MRYDCLRSKIYERVGAMLRSRIRREMSSNRSRSVFLRTVISLMERAPLSRDKRSMSVTVSWCAVSFRALRSVVRTESRPASVISAG